MDLIKTLQLRSPLLHKLIMKIQLFVKIAYYRHKRSLLFILSLVLLGHIIYFKGPQPNLKSFTQNDSTLIAYTKIKYLTPPSKLPYKDVDEKDKFGLIVAEIFGNKINGTFIEAGANDGAKGSTLYLEKNLNWTGLLVECNPNVIETLKSHNRKAWISTACLASGINPGAQNFSIPYESGIFENLWEDIPTESLLEVDTIPLFTLLAALNWTDIDYFNIDIGGNELEVLRTFPFNIITFKLLVIRIESYDNIQKKELDQLMLINNYYFVANFGKDKIFVHWSVKEKLNLKRFSKSWW